MNARDLLPLAPAVAALAGGLALALGRRAEGTLGVAEVQVGRKTQHQAGGVPRGFRQRLTPTQEAVLFPHGQRKPLGWKRARCGSWGCVYPRNLTELVKFTADGEEARAALRLQRDPVPGVVPIFGVYRLPRPAGARTPPVWALVTRRLPKPGRVAKAVGACPNKFALWLSEHAQDRGYFLSWAQCVATEADRRGVPRAQFDPFVRKTLEAVRGMSALGIRWTDLHWNNITQDANGDPMILDIGPYTLQPGEDKIAVLDGLGELPPQVVKTFDRMAQTQRGAPERAMNVVQDVAGQSLIAQLAEHVGDLTHRMAQECTISYGGEAYVEEKVKKTLRALLHPYGFAREVRETMQKEGVEYRRRVGAALTNYADEHAKLPVYNRAQWLAREAAVSVGRQNWTRATRMLTVLEKMLATKQWTSYACAYKPGPDGGPVRLAGPAFGAAPPGLRFRLKRVPGGHGWDDYEPDEGRAYTIELLAPGGKRVGYLNYNLTAGTARVRWIEVGLRRRGVGTALLDELARRYPSREITTGGFTDEGEPFWEAWQRRGS